MQLYYVYILKCQDGSYYTGHTDNIELRISQHMTGEYGGYTSTRLPLKLVFLQEFNLRDEAFHAERAIKNWSKKKKEALINGDIESLMNLAKKNFKR